MSFSEDTSELSIRPPALAQRGERPMVLRPAASSETSPDVPSAVPGFSLVLHALRRRWLLALVLAAPMSAGLAALAWISLPLTYTATAYVRIASAPPRLIFSTADQATQSDNDRFNVTQKQVLSSRYVLDKALTNSNLDPTVADFIKRKEAETADAVGWLQSALKVTFPDNAEIMQISLTASEPAGLVSLVNSIVDAYFEEEVEIEKLKRERRLVELKKAHDDRFEKMRMLQDRLKQLTEQHGATDAGSFSIAQQGALQQYTAVQTRLTQVQLDLGAEMLERELNAAAASEVSPDDLALALKSDPVSARLSEDKRKIEAYLRQTGERLSSEKASGRASAQEARLKQLDAEIKAQEAVVRDLLVKLKRQALAGVLAESDKQIKLLQAQETRLAEDVKRLEGAARSVGGASIDVEMTKFEVASAGKTIDILASEIQKTEVELAPGKQPGEGENWTRIRRYGNATVARESSRTQRFSQVVAAGVFGFALPVVAVVWFDMRKKRIGSLKDVTEGLQLNVIGALPQVPRRVMRQLGSATKHGKYWRRLMTECVEGTAALLLSDTLGGSKVILVSSAEAGEGKTTLAGQLAMTLAAAGRKTILVDFDLRRPALHRTLNLPLQPGLGEFLSDRNSVTEIIQDTDVEGLRFIAAGRWSQHGLRSLAPVALRELFTTLRSEHDFVIVDASPILPIVDSRIIGQYVDGVILSILRDVSRGPKVLAASQILDAYQIPILGVVMTGSSEDVYADRYYSTEIVDEPAAATPA